MPLANPAVRRTGDRRPSRIEVRRKVECLPNKCLNTTIKTFYPNIKISLKIFATLPVTTATAERAFSVLKVLKTYLCAIPCRKQGLTVSL
jgi:hypothetical protein